MLPTVPNLSSHSIPPLLIAGYVDTAAKRAARIGDSWMYGNLADKIELERQFGLYERALAESGRESGCFAPPMMREGFVLPDEEEAIETVRPYLQQKFQGYAGWGLDEVDFVNFRKASEDRF